MEQALDMVKIAYQALDDKLAEDIKVIDIREVSVVSDYFIIADGTNKNQVQAMVDNVQEELEKAGYPMKQMEGYRAGSWVLLDFNDIIIHIFDKENRLFYDLERIWKDGKEVNVEELISE
ncbi:ribosome silencing factor [Anaerostipes sp. MSJ-23]|uniref:ribosome silencing factor n=1 Tax=unclassified Anaerostipes TaxID=2635253 RepID=UPI001C1023C5|nr:ribosome silencing factor [Anaerostipes sp. MSJ-23]MBU5458822.1 ribosome silencing factor [Anaerostipes sp. MSJ-23]